MTPISRSDRRVLSRSVIAGLCVTIIVAAMEFGDALAPLERWLGDMRARHFQRPLPVATAVVHVDIDDASQSEIGRWPWPRSVLAGVIDELDRAGAQLIAFDVLIDQPSNPADDAALVDAVRRSGKVMLPMQMTFDIPGRDPPALRRVEELLTTNLELSVEEIAGAPSGTSRPDVEAVYLDALRAATLDRLEKLATTRPTSLPAPDLPAEAEFANLLTPKAVAESLRTTARAELSLAYERLRGLRAAAAFGRDPPAVALLSGRRAALPPAELIDASAGLGFVDFLPVADGSVRSLPLLATLRGRTFMHFSLAVACRSLGISPDGLRFERDRLTATTNNGRTLSIPVHRAHSADYGEVAMLAEVPLQGSANWLTMYDVPNHAKASRHISLRDVDAIRAMRAQADRNDAALRDAVGYVFSLTNDPRRSSLDATWPTLSTDERARWATDALESRGFRFRLRAIKGAPQDENEALLFAKRDALIRLPTLIRDGQEKIQRQRASISAEVANNVVLLGWTAGGGMDFYPTSLHAQCPGLVILGAMINGIRENAVPQRAGDGVALSVTLIAGLVATALGAWIRPTRALLPALALFAAYAFVNGRFLFAGNRFIVPLAGAGVATIAVWGTLTLYRYIFEFAERRRLVKRFRSSVDPRVVDHFLENSALVQLRGESRDMSVVFTDLAGFTTLSERLREGVVPILNEYMGRMLPIIRAHGGTWDKFIGDGIMYFFNAPAPTPDHAAQAVASVLDMHREVEVFSADLQKRGLPGVSMRAGICTGPMIVGDAGSLTDSFQASNYTVLGDRVNLAARLEAANKVFGTRSLVIDETVRQAPGFIYRPVARLRVAGKSEAVVVFEPLAAIAGASAEHRRCAEVCAEMLRLFGCRDWKKCLEAIDGAERSFGQIALWTSYREHVRACLDGKNLDTFDGCINLDSK
jgi:class 3 adenylate cyclase/CHASE2 domain-containing sensor protein